MTSAERYRTHTVRMAGLLLTALSWPAVTFASTMEVRKDQTTGQYLICDRDKPVLRYNYQTVEPGEVLAKVHAANLKYARPRSDYIHPLYGLDGEELTWTGPSIIRIIAASTGRGRRWTTRASAATCTRCSGFSPDPPANVSTQDGPVFAQIEAENLWRWEDQEPIVRELAVIRAWRSTPAGRFIDLEFQFTALKEEVAIARREHKSLRRPEHPPGVGEGSGDPVPYGSAGAAPRRAWAELSGIFSARGGDRTGSLPVAVESGLSRRLDSVSGNQLVPAHLPGRGHTLCIEDGPAADSEVPSVDSSRQSR